MDVEFHWCAPLNGDGFKVGLNRPERATDYAYIRQIFAAAEGVGFRSLLIGVGFTHHNLEGWTLAAAILPQFQTIGAMIAIRPGLYDAPLFAKMAATLDNITPNRVLLNLVTGGRPREEAMYGDFTEHDARYRRTAEFIEVCRKLWTSRLPFDYTGEFYKLQQGILEVWPGLPPPIYFGGASEAAQQVCATHADTYMMWGEPLELIKERITQMQPLAKLNNRKLKFGLRINLFARATEQAAIEAAFHTISDVKPKMIAEAKAVHTSPNADLLFDPKVAKESVGQDRQWALRSQANEDWWIRPGLWAGLSLVRRGAGMALVGSYQQVADYLLAYADIGVEVFILSGFPHLEEATNIGRNVLPLVREGRMRRKFQRH